MMSDTEKEFLSEYGWNSFFEENLRNKTDPSWVVARVIGEEKNFYRLQCSPSLCIWAELSGKFYHGAQRRLDLPATGDWVFCQPHASGSKGLIQYVFPRQTCLIRKSAGETMEEQILATNVDTVFIMTSLVLEFNAKRIERYLTMILDGGAKPVLLLTKLDLCSEAEAQKIKLECQSLFKNVPVLAISLKTKIGLQELNAFLKPGSTCVLLGSSGVGKSTFANHFLGENRQKTSDVRAGDQKGRHTTTSRCLVKLPSGALLIDTPGIRELQLLDQDEGLQAAFEGIRTLALRCKFTNCAHASEPGCAVKKAIDDGSITKNHFESYQKLQKEVNANNKNKYNKR